MDTEIYNYQISPRYLFNIKLIKSSLIILLGSILSMLTTTPIECNLMEDYYTNYKMIDKTAAFYFNTNLSLNPENKFSLGLGIMVTGSEHQIV